MKINIQNVRDFLSVQSSDTKIYIGVDSTRINSGEKWFADYTAVIVVHIDGKHGCKIFGESVVQQAIGYIRGVCNVSPRVKPDAFAASCAADRYRGFAQSTLEAA